MFFRILKKDLKRKKTMNVILLLFIMLSSMFAASSINNIIAITGGVDSFFSKAGLKDVDYLFVSIDRDGTDTLTPKLEAEPAVTGMMSEELFFITSNGITKNGEKVIDIDSLSLVLSIDRAALNYFDKDNSRITSVPEGKVYITSGLANRTGIKEGDTVELRVGSTVRSFEYIGRAKDALFGSDFMNNPRFIINDEDYQQYLAAEGKTSSHGRITYVTSPDTKAVEAAAADDNSIYFKSTIGTIRTSYIMEMIVAALLMIVSIFLIIISFIVLRFTIGFTISEEFREIGVMKAIGLKDRRIRMLYLVKYLGISVVGAAVGCVFSFPFSKLLLTSASESMVLESSSTVFICLLSSAAVVAVIMLFCYSCTKRIKKLSPIDAVRNGQTGERFRRKSIMSLGRSRLGASGFLAVNDVLSSPKRFSVMTFVFTVCLLLVMILANTADTLSSDKLLFLFCVTDSDLYISDTSRVMDVMYGSCSLDEMLEGFEDTLAENGMPARAHIETWYSLPVETEDEKMNLPFIWCGDTSAADYVYERGTPPQDRYEFAATPQVCDKLGIDIGDKVRLTVNGSTDEYMLTAVYQSMMQLGLVGRLHEDVCPGTDQMSGGAAIQIDFTDSPDEKTILERQDKLRKILGSENIFTAAEYVKYTTSSADTISAVKDLVLIITLIITAMIAVLMERSFITKEKAEIALMKAIGFKDRSIILHHTLRFAIVAALSGILAAALCLPLTKLVIDPVFGIMGATNGVSYKIEPLEIFLAYPALVLGTVVAGAGLTALCIRRIKASDTADIE